MLNWTKPLKFQFDNEYVLADFMKHKTLIAPYTYKNTTVTVLVYRGIELYAVEKGKNILNFYIQVKTII